MKQRRYGIITVPITTENERERELHNSIIYMVKYECFRMCLFHGNRNHPDMKIK